MDTTDKSLNEAPAKKAVKKPLAVKKAVKKPAKKSKFHLSAPLKKGQKLKPGYSAPLAPDSSPLPPALIKKALGDPAKIAKMKALADKIAALKKQIELAKAEQVEAEAEQSKLGRFIDEKTLRYFRVIEKECSQALAVMKSTRRLLYRGTYKTAGEVYVGKPFMNRTPTDSSVEEQDRFDHKLALAGFKALRGNSIFTTSNPHQAIDYGNLQIIFPKNGFHFTWSSEHDDIVLDELDEDIDNTFLEELGNALETMEDCIQDYLNDLQDKYPDKNIPTSYYDRFHNAIEYKFTTEPWDSDEREESLRAAANGFKAFFSIEKSIKKTLNIPKYDRNLALKYIKDPKLGKVQKISAKDAIAFARRNGFKKDNLASALRSEHEIYIHGEYIGMNAKLFEELVIQYFLNNKCLNRYHSIK